MKRFSFEERYTVVLHTRTKTQHTTPHHTTPHHTTHVILFTTSHAWSSSAVRQLPACTRTAQLRQLHIHTHTAHVLDIYFSRYDFVFTSRGEASRKCLGDSRSTLHNDGSLRRHNMHTNTRTSTCTSLDNNTRSSRQQVIVALKAIPTR